MNRDRLAALCCCAALALPAAAGVPAPHPKQPPDTKMGNVYLLAHAGAILDVCRASPEAAAFPEAKSREIGELVARLARLVGSIGAHYRDTELVTVYESTKASLASDTRLRFHVKKNHENCGERTLGEMRAYVAENEALIGGFIERKRLEAAAAAPPGK